MTGIRASGPLRRGLVLETPAAEVQRVFGSTHWKIVDTGGGLRKWQIDCYFGEDEPLGPGKFMGRPAWTPEQVTKFKAQGFQFFMTATDLDFMAAGATQFLKHFGKARRGQVAGGM